MFWFIYIWFVLLKIVMFFSNSIQRMYWVIEQPSILFSRNFYNLGYLERLFLSFFYRDNQFTHSIANVTNELDIYDYRQSHYPNIFCYHIFLEKCSFSNDDLTSIVGLYEYLRYSLFFKKFMFLRVKFCKNKLFESSKTNLNNFLFFLVFEDLLIVNYFENMDYIFSDSVRNNSKFEYYLIAFILLNNCKNKLYFFDMNYYSDWYEYCFNPKLIKKQKKMFFSRFNLFIKNKMKKQKKINFWKYYFFYYFSYKLTNIWLAIKLDYSKALKKLFNNNHKIIIYDIFKFYFTLIFKIKFKSSSNLKNISYKKVEDYSVFFLRKNRIFNKGRYSRNRQLYRTGVYWCLWLNIIIVYGLYFLFYRFTFNFGYIWIGMGVLILATIISRVLKYNYHNPFFLKKEIVLLKNWISFLILNLIDLTEYVFKNIYTYNSYSFYFMRKTKFPQDKNIFSNFYVFIFDQFIFVLNSFRMSKDIYIWEAMTENDDSLFRYKTVFHFLKQIYKSITY